ncbi:MAG: hypothetical protein RLY86_4121 [Pseudomonadota bacterium]|jgi:hypothetical protein
MAAVLVSVLLLPVLITPGAALANGAITQSPLSFGTVVTIGGTVDISTSSDNLTGGGVLASSGTVSRGRIAVSRTIPAVVTATLDSAPASLSCGGQSVPISVSIDDSGCSILSTGPCTIFVGASVFVPSAPSEGSCAAADVEVSLTFTP